ncbi:MAG: lysine--tRNA ligase [Candidatus Aenigmatarchaeota archaeon]
MAKNNEEKSLFWADQIADEILCRKGFHYLDRPVPKFKEYVVKTAASLSGVLHIGRLSDTIRCDSVYKALKEKGVSTRLIWVADDMDPLRKIPKGIPEGFSKYIGTPVTDVPDPSGCHNSYGEHHASEYLDVVKKFVSDRIETYSMREEYRKGSFSREIERIISNHEQIIEIQNRHRPKESPLSKEWFPWKPVCENCGKIITTKVVSFDNGAVRYECKDYSFEKYTAKGCGHKGDDNPIKGNGKLLYKSELAAQWAHWKVSSEGFGKEYQVPGSAFWINGEIAEKVLDFPMPVPVFYEHLLIEGEKMSASKGNVIYPSDWLKVAPPEVLRFLYNKKLMKTRSFSWSMLPNLYDDYDFHERVYFGAEKVENKKEEGHMKRLYEVSQLAVPKNLPVQIPFDFAVMVSQVFTEERFSDALKVFRKTGHIKTKLSKQDEEAIRKRLCFSRNWANLYAPEKYRIKIIENPQGIKLSDSQERAILELSKILEKKKLSQDELNSLFWAIAKKFDIKPQEFFSAVYLALTGRESGPRLAPFILAIGQKKVAGLLKNSLGGG